MLLSASVSQKLVLQNLPNSGALVTSLFRSEDLLVPANGRWVLYKFSSQKKESLAK